MDLLRVEVLLGHVVGVYNTVKVCMMQRLNWSLVSSLLTQHNLIVTGWVTARNLSLTCNVPFVAEVN